MRNQAVSPTHSARIGRRRKHQAPAAAAAVLVALVVAGCAAGSPEDGSAPGKAADTASGRALVIAISREPSSVADKTLRRTGAGLGPDTSRPFNAALVVLDERDLPHPYLAEALPELNTETWRVWPDGRMETTFRLRPNVRWHDGVALSAEDFVFAWRVYSVPEFGYADSVPIPQIEKVAAPDERSVVIRWRQPFPDAPRLDGEVFPPLPRHILEGPFLVGDAEAFVAHSYWGEGHVGLGPFRLERWELGAFIEGSGFEGHVLGPPRIDRLKLVFIGDANTVLASILSGATHTADNRSLRFQQGLVLRQRWAEGGGRLILSPVEVRWTLAQHKPEFVSPTALRDLRVRKAVVHAIDRQGLVDGLLEGQGLPADTLVVPQVEYFPALDGALAKYALDPRRSEQLMEEAGFPKAADGFFAGPGAGRFPVPLSISGLPQNEAEATIVADSLRRVGFESSIQVLSQAQATDRQVRSSYPGLSATSNTNGFEPPVRFLRASEIPTPENRWRGSNRGGWNHPEFERLVAAYDTTLARLERNQRTVDMLKLVSEELPGFALYYNFAVFGHVADLSGPPGGINWNWNVHEWYWKR